MAYKSRKEKDELKILRSLNARMLLSEEEKRPCTDWKKVMRRGNV